MEIENTKFEKYLPWLAALAIFMQTLDGTILNTALPSIAKSLDQSPLAVQSIIVAYTLTLALLVPLSGWLSDKYGTKKIFAFAVIMFTLGSLTCALSPNLTSLILSRIFQGIGGAMMVPVARLAIIYSFPKHKLLKVMNFITIPGLIGPVIGPSLGGWLVENMTWHWIFLVNIPVGLIALFMTIKFMPEYKNVTSKFDTLGLIFFAGAIVLLTLGLELIGDEGTNQWTLLACFIISIFLLLLYIKHAKHIGNPLIDLKLLKIRTLKVGLLGNLLTRLGIGGAPLLIPLLFQVGFGHPATVAGMMLIPSALATLAIKPFVSPIVKRLGYKRVLIMNTVILAIVIMVFSLAEKNTPLGYFIPFMVIFGATNSLQFASMNTISLADLDTKTASGGNSLLAIMQQLSMSFGVSVASLALIKFTAWTSLTHNDILISFKYTFLTMGFITLISTIVFFQLKNTDGDQMSGHH